MRSLVLATLLLLGALAPIAAEDDPEVVAEASDPHDPTHLRRVTRRELEDRARLTAEYRALVSAQPPDAAAIRSCLAANLDRAVGEAVLLLHCDLNGIALTAEDEAAVGSDVAARAAPYGGLGGLKETLEKISVPFESFVQVLRRNRLVGKLILRELPESEIEVTPEEVARYYDANKGTLRVPVTKLHRVLVSFDLEGLRIPTRVKPLAAHWGRETAARYAQDIRAELVANPTERASISSATTLEPGAMATAEIVGDVEPVLGETLAHALEALAPGEVSPVIESDGASHVLCLEARSSRAPTDLSQVQAEIVAALREPRWRERIEEWARKLVADTPHWSRLPR